MQLEHWSRTEEWRRLAAEEEVRRSAMVTEWERTCSPPQNKEVC